MQRSSVVQDVYGEDADHEIHTSGTPSMPSENGGTSEIGDLWQILRCRRALVLWMAAVFGVAALVYVVLTPAQYTATAQILIDPRDLQIVLKDVNPDTLAADGGVLQVESQARVIESDAVLLRAIRALHLETDPDYGAPRSGVAARFLELIRGPDGQAGPAAAEARALRALRRRLAVKRADKVFVIDVVVTALSGARAAAIADAIAEAYIADQVQSRSESSIRASDALASHLGALKTAVERAAQAVEQYKASHDLLGTDKQSISDQQLSDNGSQLNAARARTAELQARVDQLTTATRNGTDGGAMQEALQSSVVTQLRASLADLTRRQSDMRTRYGDRYPDLIAIDAEIRQARLLITNELERVVRSAHADLDRAKKAERALAAAQGALKQQTISNDQAFVTLEELVRELNARRSVYNAFLARAGETREQSNIDSTNARVISRAIPPLQPSWPLGAILVAGALGLGLGLGVALAFLREYAAPTVLSASQLGAATHVPVVGVVRGRARSVFDLLGRRPRNRAASATLSELTLVLGRLCGPSKALRGRSKPLSLLLAPARDMAGRSHALGALLASAAAGCDLSILLIDADPFTPARTGRAEPGFLDILNGDCTLRDSMVQGDGPRIHHLGFGTPSVDRQAVLKEHRLTQFLRMVELRFHLVVFCSASPMDDLAASLLAACVDDVLFVALRGATPMAEATATAEAMAVNAGRPLSAALLFDGPVKA